MTCNNFLYDWFATAKEPVIKIITRAYREKKTKKFI